MPSPPGGWRDGGRVPGGLPDVAGRAGAAARVIVHVIRPPPTAAPTSVPTSTTPALALIALDGPIEQIAQEGWVVGGTTVVLSSTTTIEGTPALGATVHVHGVVQHGGAL